MGRPNPNTWPTETTMVPDTPLMLHMVPTTTLLPTLMVPTPTATPLMEAVTCTSARLRLMLNPNIMAVTTATTMVPTPTPALMGPLSTVDTPTLIENLRSLKH